MLYLEFGDQDLEVTPAHALAEGGHHASMLARLLLQLLRHKARHPVPLIDEPGICLHRILQCFNREAPSYLDI